MTQVYRLSVTKNSIRLLATEVPAEMTSNVMTCSNISETDQSCLVTFIWCLCPFYDDKLNGLFTGVTDVVYKELVRVWRRTATLLWDTSWWYVE